jgi:putative ATP-binding cassette transporter
LVPTVGRAKVSFDKLEALGFSLDGEAAAKASPAPLPPPAGGRWESVELVGVTHRYYREGDDDHFTMGPIDLALRPGEVVFLVGGNGSGKTTLAKLIAGLYAPEEGEVRLDGLPVTDATRAAYMQHFSFVFSDFFLFDSLLGLESPGVDDEAARWLERLQLSHKVSVRDGRLSTTALSQGQRKRLALLTAYLEDRPIYIFDEWAADQDPTFKELFYLELLPALRARGKGVLVISHDDHYYATADRLLKLDYGRLEYDGDPGCLYGQPAYDDAGEAHAPA